MQSLGHPHPLVVKLKEGLHADQALASSKKHEKWDAPWTQEVNPICNPQPQSSAVPEMDQNTLGTTSTSAYKPKSSAYRASTSSLAYVYQLET